jgi:hypothetical protein
MVVDCGDNTVYLTTMQLLSNEKLRLISKRIEIDCGGDFVDQEFLKFLERREYQPDRQHLLQIFKYYAKLDFGSQLDLDGNNYSENIYFYFFLFF